MGSELPVGKGSLEPILTDHLFSAKLSNTARKISVEVTDRFENKSTESLELQKGGERQIEYLSPPSYFILTDTYMYHN